MKMETFAKIICEKEAEILELKSKIKKSADRISDLEEFQETLKSRIRDLEGR